MKHPVKTSQQMEAIEAIEFCLERMDRGLCQDRHYVVDRLGYRHWVDLVASEECAAYVLCSEHSTPFLHGLGTYKPGRGKMETESSKEWKKWHRKR